MATHVIITTTVDSDDAGQSLSHGLVTERLAACVQVSSPVRSTYWWDDEVQTAQEWQLWIKTTAALADAVTAWIAEHHTYELPEILVIPVTGSEPYLRWIDEQTR